MAINSFNAKNGLSVGASPVEIISSTGDATVSSLTVSGISNVPDQTIGDSSNLIANTKFVTNSISGHTQDFSTITGKPTTLSGYGITDALSSSTVMGGGFAFQYQFSTDTGSTPTTGKIQFNNATPSSTTTVYLYEVDSFGINTDTYLDSMKKGDFLLFTNATRTKYFVFKLSANFTSGASIDTIPVTYLSGTATAFTNNEIIFVSVSPNVIANPNFIATPSETTVALGSGSGTRAVDLSTGSVFTATATGACAWNFTNPPSNAWSATLLLTNGGLGAQTWQVGGSAKSQPTTLKYNGGTVPTYTSAGLDIMEIFSYDGGTTLLIGQAFKDAK